MTVTGTRLMGVMLTLTAMHSLTCDPGLYAFE